MTDKEAMAMALDALETEVSIDWTNNDEFNASAEKMHEAITALEARLAQPEQEPVGYIDEMGEPVLLPKRKSWLNIKDDKAYCLALHGAKSIYGDSLLYAAPPQRTEQEPVAWQDTRKTWVDVPLKNVLKEKRTWVGLTLEQYVAINSSCTTVDQAVGSTERQLKENNT